MKKITNYFTKLEICLWSTSSFFIVLSFLIFDRSNYLTLFASLIGITSLIFGAKGNPFSQALMIIFSILYGYISYTFSYFGEMITYLGMTLPMAVYALYTWLSHPYKGKKSEVEVNSISGMEVVFMLILTALITIIFYHILLYFNTANLLPSTISVTTSFLAVYLTARRSPYFALCYAANDIVLIVLWILAAKENISYLSVIVCFTAFLVNDLYGFYAWCKMQKSQAK